MDGLDRLDELGLLDGLDGMDGLDGLDGMDGLDSFYECFVWYKLFRRDITFIIYHFAGSDQIFQMPTPDLCWNTALMVINH